MAEKSTAAKSKMATTGRKLRKPLRDVSNKKTSASSKSALNPKQKHSDNNNNKDDYSLDRFLLVQSEISTLLHQIDGLVVQAFRLESMGEDEKNQIKSFSQFLYRTLDSLKPWVPSFEKVLGNVRKTSSGLECKEIKRDHVSDTDDDEIDGVESPEVLTTKSLVSPSPLVSWRDNSTVQSGKRLFLLTPLPKSTARSVMSFKQRNPTKPSFEGFSSAVPRFGLTEITCGDFLERERGVPLVEEKSYIADGAKAEKTPGCKLASTSTFSLRDFSMLVVTPRLKMSPPKSCVLLEPVLESPRPGRNKPHMSTPYPSQLEHSGGSEMSLCGSQFNEDIVFKCPVGLNSGFSKGIDNKEADAPLSWLMSPPKTCALMEPSHIKNQNNPHTTVLLPANISESDKVTRVFPAQSNDVQHNCPVEKSSFQGIGNYLHESTPMWKNLDSTVRTGKRPGENTLKKELWTKFEAASSNNFSFYASPVEAESHKGFLDRLEEVSGE